MRVRGAIRSSFGSFLYIAIATCVVAPIAGPAAAPAQVRNPDVAEYRFVSDVSHATALWVNPGALGFREELNAVGHVTWDRPEGSDWTTGQYLIGLHTHILGLGYRHDEFAPPRTVAQGDAYTIALGYASEGTGLGVSRTWRRGGRPRDGSWEIGLGYHASPELSIGLVWRDLGDPSVRDTVRQERLIGGITVRPGDASFSLSAQADYRTGPDDFREFRVGGTLMLSQTVELLGLAAWDGDGDFQGFRFGGRVPLGSVLGVGVAGLDSDGDARVASLGARIVDRRSEPAGRRR